jgi:hypothetical protein
VPLKTLLIAKEEGEKDKTGSKDLQFYKIRIKPTDELATADAQNDDESDAESYVSDEESNIDLDEICKNHTADGPRRSKRVKK